MDPISDTVLTFVNTLLTNPVTGPAIIGAVRSVTGYINYKWKQKTGEDFDKAAFGATLVKYEVAINAVALILPGDFKYVGAIVLVADILGSWGRKLLGK